MSAFAARRERLWIAAAEEGLAALLITNPINVTYLTGFSGEASYLLHTKGTTLLVSDGRFKQQIAEECPGLDAFIRPPDQPISGAAIAQIKAIGPHSIGYESGHLTVSEFQTFADGVKTADWKGAVDRVEKLRRAKDADEIAQIRQAIKIAEKAFSIFRAMLRPEDSEKELTDAMEAYVRRAGGKETAFPTIAAVGPRGALPHAPAGMSQVGEHPLLLVDWGAQGAFYKSDLTRILWSHNNVPFPGDVNRFKKVYAVVLEAQRRAIALMRPGASSKAVDTAARGFIADQGFGEFFNHGLGHGVGLQIHEAPFFRPNVDIPLEAGMVVTCEPGIYLPGEFGVRIEDDVLITPDGPEILTHCPRELEECMVEF